MIPIFKLLLKCNVYIFHLLIYFVCWNKRFDTIIVDLLSDDFIDNILDVDVQLFHIKKIIVIVLIFFIRTLFNNKCIKFDTEKELVVALSLHASMWII